MLSASGLYYETRGRGEPVLIIQGALAEAGATKQLAEVLVEAGYQVISYDHRGLSRSSGASPQSVTIESHAADAAELLTTVTDQPARVVGTSVGALIGLQLVVQHAGLVRALVAHEPPMPSLVADPDQLRGLDEVAALAADDVFAAVKHFAALGGPRDEDQEAGARPEPPVGDGEANLRQFFRCDFPAVRSYVVDVGRLVQARVPITLTAGKRSRGRWEHRCAQHLAEQLGRDVVELPGGHVSLVSHPWASASVLLSVFKEV